MRYDGRAAFDGHGFQVHVGPNKPHSRGAVRIVSDSPREHPLVQFNYLTAREDVEDWRATIKLTREILGQPAMDRFRGEEIAPGKAIQSDAEIDAWVRQSVESAYHPSCTCKMGSDDDPLAVRCRVPSPRHRAAPCGGLIYISEHNQRQPQCADHHGGRARGRISLPDGSFSPQAMRRSGRLLIGNATASRGIRPSRGIDHVSEGVDRPAEDEEILAVVDERDEVIGEERRDRIHEKALRHRAIHVLIFNSAEEVFLQKRGIVQEGKSWPLGFFGCGACRCG